VNRSIYDVFPVVFGNLVSDPYAVNRQDLWGGNSLQFQQKLLSIKPYV